MFLLIILRAVTRGEKSSGAQPLKIEGHQLFDFLIVQFLIDLVNEAMDSLDKFFLSRIVYTGQDFFFEKLGHFPFPFVLE
jgi:hypothetical protein